MTSNIYQYVNDLPYKTRLELNKILDYNNDWKRLGGVYLDFSISDLYQMELAIVRRESPTNEMLTKAGSENLTVLKLFKSLYQMKHYQAMLVLKPHINEKYHTLIPDASNESSIVEPLPRVCCGALHENSKTVLPIVKVNVLEPSGQQENVPRNQNNEPTRKVSDPAAAENMVGGTPHIPYGELSKATDNWDKLNVLGKGGFGTVYKGIWKNTYIAVKKLEVMRNDKSEETLDQCQREQSLRELKYLSSCRHDNILPLYGISFESGKYCLVYQFMPNGSLEDRLQMRKSTPPLMWEQRLHIAKGSALGLQFLHSQDPPLIHGDIKSANILLNVHMDPVIGDFGLTQEGPIEKATHVTIKRVQGTKAYLPFEFIQSKKLSTKVDVYGFGIVLFELATGMRAYDDRRVSERFLRSLVRKWLNENKGMSLVDKHAQPWDTNIINVFLKVGKDSTEDRPKERPEMIQVYNMLCGCGPGHVENSIATAPTRSLFTKAPTAYPVANNLPRHKFVKTPEASNINTFLNNITNNAGSKNINIAANLIVSSRPVSNVNESLNPNVTGNPGLAVNTLQPIARDVNPIPEASHSQEESECTGTHSSSDSDTSVEVLNESSEKLVDNKDDPRKAQVALQPVSPLPPAAQDNNNSERPQEAEKPQTLDQLSGIKSVPTFCTPVAHLFNS